MPTMSTTKVKSFKMSRYKFSRAASRLPVEPVVSAGKAEEFQRIIVEKGIERGKTHVEVRDTKGKIVRGQVMGFTKHNLLIVAGAFGFCSPVNAKVLM